MPCVCFRYLELESSGRRDEVRFHYTHDQQARVETFPYRLADGRWHRVAFTLSGSRVTLSVNCSQIYSRVIRESVDKTFSADKQQLKLFIGQRNDQHALFRVSTGSIIIEFQTLKFKVRWKSRACPLLKKPVVYLTTACFACFACGQQFCVCNFCVSGSFDRIFPQFSYNIFLFVYATTQRGVDRGNADDLSWKDQKEPPSVRRASELFSKSTLGKLVEDMVERIFIYFFSSVFCAHKYHLQLNWTELHSPFGSGDEWVHASSPALAAAIDIVWLWVEGRPVTHLSPNKVTGGRNSRVGHNGN